MNKMILTLRVWPLVLCALTPAVAQPAAPQAPTDSKTYAVSNIFHVGGEGGWDYLTVDGVHKLLFVPRSTHTMVLNAATGAIIADIPGQKRNHGVALASKSGRGFISDGGDASVVVFDLKTYAVLGKIKAEDDADGIVFDAFSNKVLLVCGNKGVLVPISADVDVATGKADPAVDLGGKPEFLTVDGLGRAYVNLVDKDQVAVVDTEAMTVVDRWSTAPGGSPVGMSIDREGRRLFVGCRNPQKLIVMSADDGRILADLPIGAGVDATHFDLGDAFASCRDGTLAVARANSSGKYEVVQTLKTAPGARTMGIDHYTHTLYLPTAEFMPPTSENSRPAPKPNTFMIVVVKPARQG